MPISCAHDVPGVRSKRDPRSEFEKALAKVDDQPNLVFACPHGCRDEKLDDQGLCEHVVGFTNANLPDGAVKTVPEGAEIELIKGVNDRDALKRRVMAMRKESLKAGDYLVRVNGTTRRVYRQANTEVKAGTEAPPVTGGSKPKTTEAPLG